MFTFFYKNNYFIRTRKIYSIRTRISCDAIFYLATTRVTYATYKQFIKSFSPLNTYHQISISTLKITKFHWFEGFLSNYFIHVELIITLKFAKDNRIKNDK